MATTKEVLDKILYELEGGDSEIDGCAVVARNGLLIASRGGSELLAAMAATMVGTGRKACDELRKGSLERVILESKDGKIVASDAGPKALLVVIASKEVNLGLLLVSMERAGEKIKEVLC